jgi:putative transposase
MQFEKGHIYHIYNQGNNRQEIFFNRDNYLFFLKKIRTYILPYSDILSWCLMPNHFHLMVLVNEVELEITHPMTIHPNNNKRTQNNSIAILLRSYTRAIQKQDLIKGNLF